MNYLNFNSRETYLAMRQQWVLDYNAKIKEVRQAKVDFKNVQRELSKLPPYGPGLTQETLKTVSSLTTKLWAAANARGARTSEVEDLVTARQEMREEANEQYHEQKSKVPV